MRIHYLLTDLNAAGAALPVPMLVSLLREQGHEVRVLALLPKDLRARAKLEQAGVDVTLLCNRPRDILLAAWRLLRILRRDRPDLLWTSLTRATMYGGIVGGLCRVPVVSWQHNAWLKPHRQRLLRLTRRLTALWVADSRTVADFAASALDIAPDRIAIWPLFRACPYAAQASAWKPGERFRIGSLGRLHADKNFHHVVEIAARLQRERPDLASRLEFVIGGDGGEREALQAQIAAAGLDNVHLAGFIDEPERFLASLHAYLQPSHHEGLCIAAHEAMRASLPVVASRVGEMQRTVVPGVTGMLCEVGDIAAMAGAVAILAADPAAAAAMGAAGRVRVMEFFGERAFRQAGIAAIDRAAALVEPR